MQDPEKAKRILTIIVEKDGDSTLISQLSGAKLSREDSTPMIFDIHVDESAQKSSRENGPLPVNAEYTQGQGSVMVFVEDGPLSHIEAPWYSDDMPTEWPEPESVRFD